MFVAAGLSGMNQGNRSEIGYLIPNFRAYTGGGFVRSTWVRGSVTLDAGARVDVRHVTAYPREAGDRGEFVHTDRNWMGLSGALGTIWQFEPSWSIAANLSAAWRPPSINELYSYGVHHGTAQFEVGEEDLRPERSLSVDATLRHQSRLVQAEASVYANRIGDYIFLDPTGDIVTTIRGVFPEFRYGQTDAVLVGVDGGADVSATDWLTLGATAALVRGSDTDANDPLLHMPADRFGLTAAFGLPALGPLTNTELELGATIVREQHRYPTRTTESGDVVPLDYVVPPPGYTVFRTGLRGDLSLGSASLRYNLTAENLFNTEYRDYLSRYRYFAHDSGRNVVLRLQVPLGGP